MRMVFGSNQRHSSECPSAKLSTQPLLCRVAGKSIQYQSSRPAKANRALSMLFSCSSIKTNAFAGGGSLICEYKCQQDRSSAWGMWFMYMFIDTLRKRGVLPSSRTVDLSLGHL